MSYDPYRNERQSPGGFQSDFVSGLNDAIRQNPISAALVGVGVLWLFAGGRNVVLGDASRSVVSGAGRGAAHAGSAAYRGARDLGGRVAAGVGEVTGAIAEAGSQVSGAVSSATGAVSGAVRRSAETVTDTASRMWSHEEEPDEGYADREPSTSMSGVGRRMQNTVSDLFEQQPLLLGAVGLAIGAGIAASMPASETEDRLMGGTADTVRQSASRLWSETTKRGGDIASKGLEEAMAQGLTPEAAANAARSVASKVVGVVDRASKDVVNRVKT
jgi:hypothetical protein